MIPVDIHLLQGGVEIGHGLAVCFHEGRQGQKLDQTGGDKGKLDMSIYGLLGSDLIVVETEGFLAVVHGGFKRPSSLIQGHDPLDR